MGIPKRRRDDDLIAEALDCTWFAPRSSGSAILALPTRLAKVQLPPVLAKNRIGELVATGSTRAPISRLTGRN